MGSGEQGGPRDTPIYSAPQGTSSTTLLACGEVGGQEPHGLEFSWETSIKMPIVACT